MRSTAQRVGDVTLVLVAFALLVFVSRIWLASDEGNSVGDFWYVLSVSAGASVLPAFAAACTYGWMDGARQRYAKQAIALVLACSAVAIVGGIVFGNYNGGTSRIAVYMEQAATLLMIAGGLTLVAGMLPTQAPEESATDA